MLACTIIPTLAVASAAYNNQYVTVVGCNMRSGAGTGYSISKTLSACTVVEDYNGNIAQDVWSYSSSKWTQVVHSTTAGYIRNDLIAPRPRCFYVTANGGLNLRSSAGGGTVKETIANGERIHVVSYTGTGWAYVTVLTGNYTYRTGYVSTLYIKLYS